METKYYIGYHYGNFEDKEGNSREYAAAFVVSDFGTTAGPDYNFGGMKAEKLACANKDVLKSCYDLQPGQIVELQFNQKGKVTKITPVE